MTAGAPSMRAGGGDLRMSTLLLASLAVAITGLHSVLDDSAWWFSAFGVMFAVFAVAAVARFYLARRWIGTLAGLVAGILALTLFFGASTAVFGFIPTGSTIAHFGSLLADANDSIAQQTLPAFATTGIQFLISLTVAGIAVAMDAAALWWRAPALVGIPLLIVLAVPSIVLATLTDGFTFVLTAVAYLLILLGRGRRFQPASAVRVGIIAVVGTFLVAAVLPPVPVGGTTGSGIGALAGSINPIVDLGADLRNSDVTPVLSYSTTSTTGEYLRLTTLDSFAGEQWAPATPKLKSGNTVKDIGAPPGLTTSVKVTGVSTSIRVAGATGSWLPLPYPSVSVNGLTGKWSWEDGTLSVRSDTTSMQGQHYSVTSLDVEPTVQQLEAAGSSADNPLAKVPAGLDPIIAATAKEVVAGAKTDFDKAVALQDWFRGGTFTYSTKTPATAGFDGSGLNVIVPFLKAKSGYCVHFATTMAIMARTLGIPSRVAVGFLPGTPTSVGKSKTVVYQVSSSNLHAWPELYFKGVGWVRFEPTPGKGFEPSFPSAPGQASSVLPVAAPTGATTTAPSTAPIRAPKLPNQVAAGTHSSRPTSSSAPAPDWLVLLAILLLLATPAVVRMSIRRRRLGRIRRGDDAASWAWQELRATARDLGIDAREASTPSELAAQLTAYLSREPDTRAAIVAMDRLRALVEDEVYGLPAHHDGGAQLADELVVVLRGLRHATRPLRRIGATVAPPTLIDRALGRVSVRAEASAL
jgi:transglutaminase-like putative cysteine protease